jgi:hypothetical protein
VVITVLGLYGSPLGWSQNKKKENEKEIAGISTQGLHALIIFDA